MKTKKKIRLSIVLYLFTVVIRLYQLNLTAVYPDEITWMVKGKEFIYALVKGKFNYFKTAWWNDKKDTYAIGIPVIVPSGISHIALSGTGKYSLKVLPDIIASRLPIIFIGSLTSVLIFLFGLNFLTPTTALITGVLYSINPIAIALDRWVLHDSFLTLFSFLAIISFFRLATDKKLGFSPGVFLALAFLVKPNGLLPFIAWLAYAIAGINRRFSFRLIFLNCLSFIIIVFILWPQMWISGPFAIVEYLSRQARLVNSGDPIPNFFLGHPTNNPHPIYYLFQFATRLPEVILLLTISSTFIFLKRIGRQKINPIIPAVLSYAAVFLYLVSTSAVKGGIRYVLPLFPWIYLSCGSVIDKINNLKHKLASPAILIIIFLASYPLSYFPNYYLYYNYLIGGQANAVRYDLFGACFGSKEALEYLDNSGLYGLTGVIGCSDTAPYHSGRPLTKDFAKATYLIVESSFVQQHPDSSLLTPIKHKTLIKQIFQQEVVTAKIYR